MSFRLIFCFCAALFATACANTSGTHVSVRADSTSIANPGPGKGIVIMAALVGQGDPFPGNGEKPYLLFDLPDVRLLEPETAAAGKKGFYSRSEDLRAYVVDAGNYRLRQINAATEGNFIFAGWDDEDGTLLEFSVNAGEVVYVGHVNAKVLNIAKSPEIERPSGAPMGVGSAEIGVTVSEDVDAVKAFLKDEFGSQGETLASNLTVRLAKGADTIKSDFMILDR